MSKRATLNVADLFCGAGGTSTGAVEAIRRLGYLSKLTAVNHWDVAVATHSANHPDARHLCASIDSTNPRDLFGEGELDLLWASPECMGHSVALGGRPVNDQSRATAWCVLRWADALLPPVILIENVPEFAGWAPLGSNSRPLKSRKGEVFQAFLAALRSLGYRVDYRVLCAADYGDPTTRRRLFIQAVRGRRRIVWPHATHAPVGNPTLFASKPWVAARSIIDPRLKGESIYGRKRPLSEKTFERIYEGLMQFGLNPFLLPKLGFHPNNKALSIDAPVNTVISDGRIGLVEPFIINLRGTDDSHIVNSSRSIDEPLATVTGRGTQLHVAQPYLVQVNRGNGDDPNANARRVRSVEQPLPTVCGNGEWYIANPYLVPNFGERDGQKPRAHSVDEPAPTVTSRGAGCLVQPMLLPQGGGGVARPIGEPAPTVATDGAIALIEPFIVKYYGSGGLISLDQPLDTVTTRDRFGLVRPVLKIEGERYLLEILYRMLEPHELAGAQGFPSSYRFTGNKTQIKKQIGNAVPRRLARALVAAVLSQDADVTRFVDDDESGVAA